MRPRTPPLSPVAPEDDLSRATARTFTDLCALAAATSASHMPAPQQHLLVECGVCGARTTLRYSKADAPVEALSDIAENGVLDCGHRAVDGVIKQAWTSTEGGTA